MAERKQERVYSAEEAAERLKRELPHWYFEDGWIRRRYKTSSWKGTLMVINAVGHLAGGLASPGHHRFLRLGRGPLDEPCRQGHHRQGLRARQEDRGGGGMAAGPRRRSARGTPQDDLASPTSNMTSEGGSQNCYGLPAACNKIGPGA